MACEFNVTIARAAENMKTNRCLLIISISYGVRTIADNLARLWPGRMSAKRPRRDGLAVAVRHEERLLKLLDENTEIVAMGAKPSSYGAMSLS